VRVKSLYWRNGWLIKVLERVAERDDFLTKPVRYRATTRVMRPFVRANNYQIHVWLPIELAPLIPELARLTRNLKRSRLQVIAYSKTRDGKTDLGSNA